MPCWFGTFLFELWIKAKRIQSFQIRILNWPSRLSFLFRSQINTECSKYKRWDQPAEYSMAKTTLFIYYWIVISKCSCQMFFCQFATFCLVPLNGLKSLNWGIHMVSFSFCVFSRICTKVSSSYHLCVECFSQLSFDSEVYTKSTTTADFVYTSESNESREKHSMQRW